MRRRDIASSTILFLIGLFILLYAPRYGLGSLGTPGSGFMPFFTGLVICSFSMIVLVKAFIDKSTELEQIWAEVNFPKLIITILIVILYIFLLKKLGFIICTFPLMLILFRYIGYQSWLISIVGASLSSIIAYLLFEIWLNAQLPKGIFGF